MISYRFQLTADAGSGWTGLTPDDPEWKGALEIARALGETGLDDLMRIELPGGASRYGFVRVVMPTASAGAMFSGAAANEDGGLTFRWTEKTGGPVHSLRVWPTRFMPFSWPTMGGWGVVEARDVRWLARFRAPTDPSEAAQGPMRTDDGRFLARTASGSKYSAAAPFGSMLRFCQYLAQQAQLSVDWGAFDPPAESMARIEGIGASWQDAATLILDQCMALCGWVLIPDTLTGTLTAVELSSDVATLGAYMQEVPAGPGFGRIWHGGIRATGDDTDTLCDLMDQWNASATMVQGLGPYASKTSAISARREGSRRYDNQADPQTDETALEPPTGYATTRPMSLSPAWGKATLFGWTKVPRNTENLTYAGFPTEDEIASFADGVWGARSKVAFGRQAWSGWPALPIGSYRATRCVFCLRWLGGQAVPVTVTEASEDDWLLGNNGALNARPDQMLTGIGNIDTQITPGGGRLIRVPPPQVRCFMARITNYTQIGDEWRWQYEWEEVEPQSELLSDDDRWESSPPLTRAWDDADGGYLENVIERGNTVGSRVAPGILQSDLPTGSTLEALPLPVGTIVPVQQLAPTVFPGADDPLPPKYAYTTCIPNGIKVTCP